MAEPFPEIQYTSHGNGLVLRLRRMVCNGFKAALHKRQTGLREEQNKLSVELRPHLEVEAAPVHRSLK